MQLSNKPTTSFVPSVDGNSNKDINREMNMYTVSNNGYAVDATNLDICVLLSEMLPNRPLYSHCLKVVVRFQGKYGRFMIDRYSSTFSCARFTGDDRTKKEVHGNARRNAGDHHPGLQADVHLYVSAGPSLKQPDKCPTCAVENQLACSLHGSSSSRFCRDHYLGKLRIDSLVQSCP